jgi:ankyrin repeat protein
VSDLGLARLQVELGSVSAGVGAPKFRAPEAESSKYTTKRDVWSFGILIGELCTIPKQLISCPEHLKDTAEETYLQKMMGTQWKQTKKWKIESLTKVETRVGNEGFLLELTQKCLHVFPENRPQFSELSETFRGSFHSEFNPNFLELVEKEEEMKRAQTIATRFGQRVRESYKGMKITSFEWNQDEISDGSSQLMASAAIDFAFINLELEEMIKTDQQNPKSEEIKLEDIWGKKFQRFVVQGRAGAGKSTLLKWIAYKWAIGDLWQDFDFVIHATLREIQSFQNLESMVLLALSLGDNERFYVDQLLFSKSKILWLLDGWDEIQSTGVLKLIQEDREPRVQWLIVGTRPETARISQSRILNVLGFSEEGRQKYISRYFSSEPEKSARLKTLVKQSHFLDDACTLPLFLNLVCFAFPRLEQSEMLNFSEIYDEVLDQLLMRTMNNHSKEHHKELQKMRDQFATLGFNFFQKKPIRARQLDSKLLKTGVLHSKDGIVHWNHVTFAEFYGAKYCVEKGSSPSSDFQEHPSYLFFVFYCSLAQTKEAFQEFYNFISSKKQNFGFNWKEVSLPLSLCCVDCGELFWEEMLESTKKCDLDQLCVLEACVMTGNLKLCLLLCKEFPDLGIHKCGISLAASLGIQPLVHFFVDRGADKNVGLEHAVEKNQVTIVRALVGRGADPNRGLIRAILRGFEPIVQILLDCGAEARRGINYARSEAVFLMLLEKGVKISLGRIVAVLESNRQYSSSKSKISDNMIKLLVEKGADLDGGIDWAELEENVDMIRFLVEKGADPNEGICWAKSKNLIRFLVEKGASLNNGIIAAASQGYGSLVKFLVEKGADPNKGIEGAARKGHESIVKFLVEKSADPNKGIRDAAREGHESIVIFLVEKGADPNNGIAGAGCRGHESIVKLLVEEGADPNKGIGDAAREGHESIVIFLVEKGADPNNGIRDAARKGHESIVIFLVEKGTDPNNGIGDAAREGHESIVIFLVEKGADPNYGIRDAAREGHESIVIFLVEKGADPSNGIECAARKGHESIVKFLVEKGADPNKGIEGAARKGHESIVKFLVEKCADPFGMRDWLLHSMGANFEDARFKGHEY